MAPIIRILARYGIGLLIGSGFISSDLGDMLSADPDVQLALEVAAGALAAAAVEGWYWFAKRFGGKT